MSNYNTFLIRLWAPYGRGINQKRLVVYLWKTFLILVIQVWPWHVRVFSMNLFPHFSGVFQPLQWFPGVSILWASGPFHKLSELFDLLVYPSDLSSIGDYLTFHNSFNLSIQVTFDVLWFPSGLFSAGSVRDFIGFEKRDVKYWVAFPLRRDIEFEPPTPSFF